MAHWRSQLERLQSIISIHHGLHTPMPLLLESKHATGKPSHIDLALVVVALMCQSLCRVKQFRLVCGLTSRFWARCFPHGSWAGMTAELGSLVCKQVPPKEPSCSSCCVTLPHEGHACLCLMPRKGGRASCLSSVSCICLNAWAALMAVCNSLPCAKACSIVWCCNLIGHARRQWPHAGGLLLPGILGCALPKTHCC